MKGLRIPGNVVIAGAMIASIGFSAATRGSTTPAYAAGTVNFASWSSNPTEKAALTKLLASFTSKYHIKVNYQVLNGDYNAVLKSRLTAGTAPDVFYINSDHAQDYIRTGALKDLTFLKNDKSFGWDAFYKNVQSGFKYKGKTYGFAKDYSTLALWYNKDLFKAAGISKPPTTWAALQTDACKLTDKSKKQYGISLSTGNADRFMAFVYQAGGSLLNKSLTKATIKSAATKKALEFYTGLAKKGCGATPSTMGAGWNGEAFGRANAAMAIEGNWLTSAMQQTYPTIHWGVAPLPKGPKGGGNLIFTASYSMWAKTPHLKDATTLMKFLAGKNGEEQWARDAQYIPSRKDAKALPGAKVFIQQVKYSHDWFFPPGFQDRALTPIGDDIQKVMEGQMTVDQALSDMQDQANKALQGAP
ncbi:MAG: ABC transporter substrate-binding protein [Chloroflexota bacterium]